ncbi:MAG: DNA repair exonuclease [Trueperaceae bacterium]|nr:DNA repair exonuclease [Trueperaceae bacterium]MCW5821088.1 DNA repair exonuclease [Trueperaceae bacterium]
MTTFSFAHLADLHLDTPFSGVRSRAPELARALRDASLDAWDRAVELCLDAGVDFVLLAGDVYDGDSVGVRAQLRFRDGLLRLSEAGVASFVVHGNHDPRGGRWTAVADWPERVTVFGHDDVARVRALRGGEPVALVHGISHAGSSVTENLAARYARDPDFPGFQIGLLHANVGGLGGHGNYAPATLADLRDSGLDYWALGHVHARTVVSPERPLAIYPGNLQARDPGEAGAKGLYLVEVEDREPTARFVSVGIVSFETLTVDIGTGLADLEAVRSHLVQAALRARGGGSAGGTDHGSAAASQGAQQVVLRVRVHGVGPAHAGLRNAGEAGLLAYLQDVAPAGVWWDEVRITTRPPLDREARMRAGDFVADVLRSSAERVHDAPEAVARLVEELLGNRSLQAVRQELDLERLSTEAADIWAEAETLAFDLLDAPPESGV